MSTDTMRSYLSPVDAVHEMAGYEPPTAHPIFSCLRKGYKRLTETAAGGMPSFVGPLPVDIMLAALSLGGLRAPSEMRRACAGLVLAFLMFNRPGAAAAVRAADMRFTRQGLSVQQVFHKSEARTRARSAFLIPVHPRGYAADAPLTFLRAFRRDYLAAGGSLWWPMFAAPGTRPGPRVTSEWLRLLLSWTGTSAPLGVRWTGRSIRSGAATAANAIGLPLPVVAAYMEHGETAVTARHYVDGRLGSPGTSAPSPAPARPPLPLSLPLLFPLGLGILARSPSFCTNLPVS